MVTSGPEPLQKVPSGIRGLDEITFGGLPRGRTTLITGRAGSGKTLLAMEFLVRGANQFGEPGVFMAFEETEADLRKNFASLGFDLDDLAARELIVLDHVRVVRAEIEETGDYDLEGLFIRLGLAIDSIGAKRVVLDTIETLFSGLTNTAILRAELRRLFQWLKDRGVTSIVTGEAGEGPNLTRQGLEEYVSDCVIALDHRVSEQLSTRRLRVAKYRGSAHGTNEYPFVIDEHGIALMPITSVAAEFDVSTEWVPTGIPQLDTMLDGQGFYRGSAVLISGGAGTGKTTFAASFARAACEAGQRVLYVAFEEPRSQIIRNMRSAGIDLQACVDSGHLVFHGGRPDLGGLEMHLVEMQAQLLRHEPDAVVVDPITAFVQLGSVAEVRTLFTRLIDFIRASGATSVLTSLTHGGEHQDTTGAAVSSIIDTWIMLRHLEVEGERNRVLTILKSRGMPHSNQMREFELTSHGVELSDVTVGSARRAQVAPDRDEQTRSRQAGREK